MAMTLDGVTGLFAQVGAFHKALKNVEALTNITDDDRRLQVAAIRAAAQNFLIRYVSADTPINPDLRSALEEVCRQAIDQSESCDQPADTLSDIDVTAMTTSSVRFQAGVSWFAFDKNAQLIHNGRPHAGRIECTHAPLPGQGNYAARFRISSTPLMPIHQSGWFSGLGYNGRLTLASAQLDAGNGSMANILVNGGFERVNSNLPDNWTASTWVAGTHFNAVTTPYIGTNALRLIGDGATNGKLRQALNDPSGSPIQLKPRSFYHFGSMVRRYATGAVTGIVRFSIENAAGTELYSSGLAVNVATLDTTYTSKAFLFYTGDTVSATNYFVIESTTAIGNTHEVFIDEQVLLQSLVIPGVGRLSLVEGSAAAQVGDYMTWTLTNDGTGLQLVAWDRLFDMNQYDLCMPANNAGSETILDILSVSTPN